MFFRAPRFWDEPPGFFAYALSPLAAAYGAAASARLRRPGPRADLPTFVVGGLTLGGDGKTPLAMAIAAALAELGERPAILCRGYGRAKGADALVVVDPARHSARDVGDEALLHAARRLTIVGADRLAAARLAKTLGATTLVLDDGLHSRALQPDFAFLVVDADYGAGAGYCPPAGPLRAPLAAQAACVDALVVIGGGEAWRELPVSARLLRARLAPEPTAVTRIAGARIFAFAGVGRPQKFKKTLEEAGAAICGFRAFPDHYPYAPSDVAALTQEAGALRARLVTTQKDAVRLNHRPEIDSLPVRLLFERQDELQALMSDALNRRRNIKDKEARHQSAYIER